MHRTLQQMTLLGASICNTLQHLQHTPQYTTLLGVSICITLQQTAHCITRCFRVRQCCCRVCRSATYCNTLQHTATHCNTLQHTATHYNTLQHTAKLCETPQMLFSGAQPCNTAQHFCATTGPQQKIGNKGLFCENIGLFCVILYGKCIV